MINTHKNSEAMDHEKEDDFDRIIRLTREQDAAILAAEVELATTNPTIH